MTFRHLPFVAPMSTLSALLSPSFSTACLSPHIRVRTTTVCMACGVTVAFAVGVGGALVQAHAEPAVATSCTGAGSVPRVFGAAIWLRNPREEDDPHCPALMVWFFSQAHVGRPIFNMGVILVRGCLKSV